MLKKFYTWFVSDGDTVTIAYFRIMVALFCILKMVVVKEYLFDIYGQYGYIQWAITKTNLFPGLPHLGDIAIFLGRWGVTPNQSVLSILLLYCLCALFLSLGFLSRFMAILLWFINFLWMHSGGGLTYGMDIFHHIALFYCAIMPVGNALSLDILRAKKRVVSSQEAGVSRHLLQLHLCIMYTSSGFEKAVGIQWWNGEAIWRSMMLPIFHSFDMGWLAQVPWLPMVLGWGVLAIEIGYSVFVWIPRTRLFAVTAILLMHIMIGVFLGLQLFAVIMVILNLGAFGAELQTDLRVFLRKRLVGLFNPPATP